jgi:uncharacterized membrane protein YphA (DoxX/SURF4 family)
VAGLFIAEGIDVLRHPEPHVDAVAPIVDRMNGVTLAGMGPAAIVRGTGGGLVASGLLIALGIAPRLGGAAAAAVLAPATAVGYQFWTKDDPSARRHTRADLLKSAALTGAALLIAADTSTRDARRLAAARRQGTRQG